MIHLRLPGSMPDLERKPFSMSGFRFQISNFRLDESGLECVLSTGTTTVQAGGEMRHQNFDEAESTSNVLHQPLKALQGQSRRRSRFCSSRDVQGD